jgi:hypothetical protein
MPSVQANSAPKGQGKAAPGSDADQLQIPMSKTNPLWIGFGVLGVLLVVGAVVWVVTSGDSGKSEARAKRESGKYLSKEELEARRKHMEITQKSLANVPKESEKSEAPKAAPAAKPAAAARPRGGWSKPSAPAKKPVSGKAAKKQLDALDNLGNDIASQLK